MNAEIYAEILKGISEAERVSDLREVLKAMLAEIQMTQRGA